MVSLYPWIKAVRLRTLPLSLASIVMAGFLAATVPGFNLNVVIMAGITTLFLQILSNLANDYGDSRSGVDNPNRLGPKRTVQTGEISPSAMKKAMALLVVLSLISGLILIFLAASLPLKGTIAFLVFGASAIVAAITYTVGKKPYGYIGLGDLFVFIFFGLLGVKGTWYLATQTFEPLVILPSAAMGLLSAGVINLNNMRDMVSDQQSGKVTVASKIGMRKAFYYQCLLVLLPFVLLSAYVFLAGAPTRVFLIYLLLPFYLTDLRNLRHTFEGEWIDPLLSKLSVKILFLTIMFGVLLNW
ncbi:MAG TPA: 1,4-dihydroxy-2-naphthoate octaprenyltransferase [Bacteroidales bacterium]|nr:1,4-dihydroxy-2-naphthoate octaprenyltransferase [Bacteroidales bacterium]